VDLFFVLSGFLVGGLLLRELRDRGEVDAKRFLVRRIFKIWPSYFLLIGVVFALMSTIDPPRDAAKAFHHVLPNLLQIQNYWISPRIQTWSLAIEEHFYLVLPFVVAFAGRSNRPGTWIGIVAAILLVGCFALRCLGVARGVTSATDFVFPTHLRLDSLFAGVLLAYAYHYHADALRRLTPWRAWLAVAGIALVSPMAVIDLHFSPFVVTVGFTLLYLGYGLLLLAALLPTLEATSSSRGASAWVVVLLAAVGRVSYPMYLWFPDVQTLLGRLGLPPQCPARLAAISTSPSVGPGVWWIVTQVCYVVATVAVGYLMTVTVEKPGLALRDRLFPPRASALR
jgi:peptidoglycan/LPS O-acetylase OafA/YrhL